MTAIEWATVIGAVAAILAVMVPLYTRWADQRRSWHFTITEQAAHGGNPARLHVTFRNDGTPDIALSKNLLIVIDEADRKMTLTQSRFSHTEPINVRLSTEDEAHFHIGKSALADDRRMLDIWDACVVRVVLEGPGGRRYRSDPFTVLVEDWLDADASARKLKPRPEPS